jgi:hypothetical protein
MLKISWDDGEYYKMIYSANPQWDFKKAHEFMGVYVKWKLDPVE